jgi:hypothetical protein
LTGTAFVDLAIAVIVETIAEVVVCSGFVSFAPAGAVTEEVARSACAHLASGFAVT